MPTLNLYPPEEKLLPPRGVYYSRVLFEGGTYPGITNIGYKPTVNEEKRSAWRPICMTLTGICMAVKL